MNPTHIQPPLSHPAQAQHKAPHSGRLAKLSAMSLIGLMGLTLAGCAALAPPKPEEKVRQLATQRWQTLLAGKFDAAYKFTTPAYRQIRSVDHYQANRSAVPVKWISAEVLRVDCETERCTARIKLVSKPVMPGFNQLNLESGLDEIWIQEKGQWWIFEKP